MKEIQLLHWKHGELLMTSTTFVSGSTIGEQFNCRVEWHVFPTESGCHVDVVARSEYKGVLFKSVLETYAIDMARTAFEAWIELCRARLRDYRPEVPPASPARLGFGLMCGHPQTLSERESSPEESPTVSDAEYESRLADRITHLNGLPLPPPASASPAPRPQAPLSSLPDVAQRAQELNFDPALNHELERLDVETELDSESGEFFDATEQPGDPVPVLLNRLQVELALLKSQMAVLWARLTTAERLTRPLCSSLDTDTSAASERPILARLDEMAERIRAAERRRCSNSVHTLTLPSNNIREDREKLLLQRIADLERTVLQQRRIALICGSVFVAITLMWPFLLRVVPRFSWFHRMFGR